MTKYKFLRTLVLSTALAAVGTTAMAASLKIGDPAPPLKFASFAQGDPVTGFDSNHVYIVEFWATWCGPCRASIPHLNEVWQKYKDKDLIVIGSDCWEQDETAVPGFIKQMGEKMTYRVALDDKSEDKKGAMAANWMAAAGQNGIPTAFIIDRHGKVAWIGHPMSLEDSVVEDILADKFDVAAFGEKFAKQQQADEERNALSTKLRKAMQDKNWDAADAALSDIEKSLPEKDRIRTVGMKMQILMGRNDLSGAYQLAESTSSANPTNIGVLYQLASILANAKDVDAQGIKLAVKTAELANTASKEKESPILALLAKAQLKNGQTNEAVASAQKAVDLAPEEGKEYYKQVLKECQGSKTSEQ